MRDVVTLVVVVVALVVLVLVLMNAISLLMGVEEMLEFSLVIVTVPRGGLDGSSLAGRTKHLSMMAN
jgi:uncharacterized membrane protein